MEEREEGKRGRWPTTCVWGRSLFFLLLLLVGVKFTKSRLLFHKPGGMLLDSMDMVEKLAREGAEGMEERGDCTGISYKLLGKCMGETARMGSCEDSVCRSSSERWDGRGAEEERERSEERCPPTSPLWAADEADCIDGSRERFAGSSDGVMSWLEVVVARLR